MMRARATPVLGVAMLAACGTDVAQPPDEALRLSEDSVRLWVGDTIRLSADLSGPDGPAAPPDLEWSSTTAAVEVSATGLVRAIARGQGRIRVSGAGQSAEIPVTSLFVIRGRTHAAGGGDLSGLHAVWTPGTPPVVDSAPVAADGSFTIRTSGPEAMGELLIDGKTPRSFHPVLFPFDVDLLGDVGVVLIPRSWTIERGIYQGGVVATPLDPVVDDDANTYRYSYFFGQPYPFASPTAYLLDLMTWPEDRFPATVAFDHQHGSATFSAQDSINIWGVLDRMEVVFGLDLFTPGEAQAGWWPDPPAVDPGLVPGVIRLVFSPPSWGGLPLSEAQPLVWEDDLGEWATSGRFSAFRLQHRLLDGGALLIGALDSLLLADGLVPWETVLMHEMLHVLGVGHTCRIPSPQGPCFRTEEPSPSDVAYMELLRETMRLEREHDTFLGLLPAVIGERRVLLDRSALPELMP